MTQVGEIKAVYLTVTKVLQAVGGVMLHDKAEKPGGMDRNQKLRTKKDGSEAEVPEGKRQVQDVSRGFKTRQETGKPGTLDEKRELTITSDLVVLTPHPSRFTLSCKLP